MSRPGLGARRAAAHAAPVPASPPWAVARGHDRPLVELLPPSGAASRVLAEVEPGAGQSSEDAIKGRTLPVEEGGGGFAGTLAECPCERLPRCEWGFSSVARRLGNVSGSTSVAPASSPHDGRFSGTPSLSCTVCARPTPTGEVRGAGEGLRSRGRTRRAPRPGPDARASGGQSSPG